VRIKSDTLAALAVALAPVFYFMPAVRGQVALCPDDGLLFNVPLRVAAARIKESGRIQRRNQFM
jgi:hypothetical protein